MQLSKELVMRQLGLVVDPEVGLTITDMGLVYGVEIQDGVVEIRMTLTTPGCPMGRHIADQVNSVISPLEGVRELRINIVWEPRWSPSMIKPEAREALNQP